MVAYAHFGGAFTSSPNGPFLTTEVPVKEEKLWWQEEGLSFTASGYGKRIPTRYKVLVHDRWRRVYCCLYSNNGTCYVESGRKPLATIDIYI